MSTTITNNKSYSPSVSLLKELIKSEIKKCLVIEERAPKALKISPKFSKLKSLSRGSTRVVYANPNNRTVFKVAHNDYGIKQNKNEANLSNKSPLFAKVVKVAPDFTWIEMERVDPDRRKVLDAVNAQKMSMADLDYLEGAVERGEAYERSKTVPLAAELERLAKKYKIGDFSRPENWGVTPLGGELRLIDYGVAGSYKHFEQFEEGVSSDKPTKDQEKTGGWFDDKPTRRPPLRPSKQAAFNMETLKQIEDPQKILKYAMKTLGKPLGQGSARIVFRLPDGDTVLKIAHNQGEGLKAGLGQNEGEATASDFSQGNMFAKVLQKSPDGNYTWIVSEYAKPLTSERDFERITKIGWYHFLNTVSDWDQIRRFKSLPWSRRDIPDAQRDIDFLRQKSKWFDTFLRFLQVGNILSGGL